MSSFDATVVAMQSSVIYAPFLAEWFFVANGELVSYELLTVTSFIGTPS